MTNRERKMEKDMAEQRKLIDLLYGNAGKRAEWIVRLEEQLEAEKKRADDLQDQLDEKNRAAAVAASDRSFEEPEVVPCEDVSDKKRKFEELNNRRIDVVNDRIQRDKAATEFFRENTDKLAQELEENRKARLKPRMKKGKIRRPIHVICTLCVRRKSASRGGNMT